MDQEAILIEAVALADEILEYGPHDGRGMRLAGLIHRLNEAMGKGDVPMSWRPPPVQGKPSFYPPPPPRAPDRQSLAQEVIESIPDPDELDAAWDHVFSVPPPPPPSFPSSFPKSTARITKFPKPAAIPQREVIELLEEDVEIAD